MLIHREDLADFAVLTQGQRGFIVLSAVDNTRLAFAAQMEYSALLGISRALVYSMAPIAGVLIIVAQIINLYEDITGRELTLAAREEMRAQLKSKQAAEEK